jgi:aspartate 1-decarboxylase
MASSALPHQPPYPLAVTPQDFLGNSMRWLMRSKIHKAIVTEANLNYVGSGEICVNGAAAHLINCEQEIIVIGFELTDKAISPRVIMPANLNKEFEFLIEQAGASA